MGTHQYCKFALHKVQKDTISAISLLAKFVHAKPNRFMYGGTKDRRAVTTQWITVDLPAKQLIGIALPLYHMHISQHIAFVSCAYAFDIAS